MRGYTKEDVTLHSEGFGRGRQPAVNVKVGSYPGSAQVVERFGCSEETAQRALEYALEAAQEWFWQEDVTAFARFHLGPEYGHKDHQRRRVWSEGRSSGWLVVSDLPPVEEWDGVMLNKWALFERAIRREVDHLSSWEWVEDMIAANEWAVDQTAIEGMLATALA
jgi:hypothetical protein